jgi:hypothetical protein
MWLAAVTTTWVVVSASFTFQKTNLTWDNVKCMEKCPRGRNSKGRKNNSRNFKRLFSERAELLKQQVMEPPAWHTFWV